MQIEALYLSHGPALLRYLQRQFGAVASAEDLLQETFVEALDSGDSCLAAESPRAFLFGIARNLGLSAHRRAKVRHTLSLPQIDALPADAENPALADMREAISRLPDHLRETLELRLRDNLSYEEIAAILEIPLGTVRSRLHTAVKHLRSAL